MPAEWSRVLRDFPDPAAKGRLGSLIRPSAWRVFVAPGRAMRFNDPAPFACIVAYRDWAQLRGRLTKSMRVTLSTIATSWLVDPIPPRWFYGPDYVDVSGGDRSFDVREEVSSWTGVAAVHALPVDGFRGEVGVFRLNLLPLHFASRRGCGNCGLPAGGGEGARVIQALWESRDGGREGVPRLPHRGNFHSLGPVEMQGRRRVVGISGRGWGGCPEISTS